jgi:hypothetical protein
MAAFVCTTIILFALEGYLGRRGFSPYAWLIALALMCVGASVVTVRYLMPWYLTVYSAWVVPPLPPGPSPEEMVDALRRLNDALSGSGDEVAVSEVARMRVSAPLTHDACLRLTVASSSAQRMMRDPA